MHLIIDGYNLLATVGKSGASRGLQSETARDALVKTLASYRQRKGHVVTLVFDGWQQGRPIETREHQVGVEVIYSKRGERADQVIQRLAREYGSDCAVVSSDHEIVNYAKVQGAFVMTAQEFSAKLDIIAPAERMIVHKELDQEEHLRPKRGSDKRGNPRKLPKALRQRSRRLKRF